jgi:type II secretory pathway pseudopilin PulG
VERGELQSAAVRIGLPRTAAEPEAGITLIESLLALFLLGIVVVGILPVLVIQASSNTRNERRSAAVSAVQMRLEELRLEDPAGLPATGSSAPQVIAVGRFEFDVVTRYCTRPSLCNATSRHLTIEASLDQRKLYDVETVFTAVR